MNNIRSRVLSLAGAVLLGSVSAAAAKPLVLELNLPKQPAVPRPEMAALLTAAPLTLEVIDAREGGDPAVVGAQRAKGEDLYFWRVAQPVAPAVKEHVTRLLNGWSVHVVPEAEFGLRLHLTNYYVTEKSETFGSTYVADVRFALVYVDSKGGVLWTGEAAGTAKRSGVDARASMCNETLSVALRGALAKAMSQVSLETATRAAPPATPSPLIAIEPDALFVDLTRLKTGGVADDLLVAYVEQRKLSRPLNVDEILRWKDAGIPDAAIKAATRP